MGYYIEEADFMLRKENIQKAWEKFIKRKKQIGWSSWKVIENCHSFQEVMIECGWEIYANQARDYNHQ